MNGDLIVVMVIYTLSFIVLHLLTRYIQGISGSGYFYGVYVKNIEINKEEKQKIDKTYKRQNTKVFLLSILFIVLIALFWPSYFEFKILIGMFIYIFGAYYYLMITYKKVRKIKNEQTKVIVKQTTQSRVIIDTEFLNGKQKIQSKFKKIFMLNIAISVISFIYVILNYSSIPEMVPMHWNGSGEIDGYATKSIMSVFSINFIDLGIVILMYVMTISTLGARVNIDTTNIDVTRKKALTYLNRLGYSFWFLTIAIQAMISTIPFYMVNGLEMPTTLIWVPFVVIIPISILTVYYFIMLSYLKSRDKSIMGRNEDEDNWLYGFIYYNKNDSSLMVEKRFGAGWTFNMANRKAQVMSVIMFIWIIGMMILPFTLD